MFDDFLFWLVMFYMSQGLFPFSNVYLRCSMQRLQTESLPKLFNSGWKSIADKMKPMVCKVFIDLDRFT